MNESTPVKPEGLLVTTMVHVSALTPMAALMDPPRLQIDGITGNLASGNGTEMDLFFGTTDLEAIDGIDHLVKHLVELRHKLQRNKLRVVSAIDGPDPNFTPGT